MKRAIAAALVAALLLAVCAPALAAQTASARTSIAGLAWEKVYNLELAVDRIDGVSLPSGASFSFNAIIGDRSLGSSYLIAPDGWGLNAVGGGVDQAAATLCLALNQLGGVRFDEKHTYGDGFVDSYIIDGGSAVRTDSSSGLDFCFTNLGGDLTIQMYVADSYLHCVLSAEDRPAADSFLTWDFGEQRRALVGSATIALDGSSALKSNVLLAASSINDTVLSSGDLFSFNDAVGPRTKKYGYQEAVNGRGVEVVGGGVAQVASAIWLAIKNLDGVAIVKKSTYGGKYNQHYVDSSNDAILTDYSDGTDFSFRNTGTDPLTIATYVFGDNLYCDIYRN